MKKNAIARAVVAGALLALLAPAHAHASGKAGTSSAQFLKLGAGARAAALGDSFAAIADDVSAVYWNPAGIAQLEGLEISAMQNNGLAETQYQFAGAAMPAGKAAVGLSVYRMDYGSIDGFTAADVPTGDVDAGSLAAGLTIAGKVNANLHLGATAKLVQEKIDGESASTVAGDAGLLWKDGRFSAGLVLQHLGGTMKFDREAEDLPMTVRADGAMRFTPRLTVTAGVAKSRDNDMEVHGGAEISVGNVLQIRGGYAVVPGNTLDAGGLSGVSGGVGVLLGRFSLDYGVRPFGDLGLSHRISLTARFGSR